MSAPAARLGGLILAGGASLRMGRDKATLEIGGSRAVDRLVHLAGLLGAGMILTSGQHDYGYPNIADAKPLGGPVGGILAGAAALSAHGCETMLVLAVDAPTLTAQDLRPLFEPAAGAAFSGFPLPFVAPIRGLPQGANAGWPISRLLDAWGVGRIAASPAAAERLKGANTPEEFQRLVQAVSGSGVFRR